MTTFVLATLVVGCDDTERHTVDALVTGNAAVDIPARVEAQALAVLEPLAPPAPGTPSGLPLEASVAPQGAIDPAGAEGAAQVVQGYYGLLEAGRFADAQDVWHDGTDRAGEDPARFAKHFALLSEIHANVGAPGKAEGAAGSLYVTVPVQVYARLKANGKPYYALRAVVLRRANDVPGSTAAQRRWHIARIGAWPPPDRAADPQS